MEIDIPLVAESTPILVDYATASTPCSDHAKELAQEAFVALARENNKNGIKGLASGRLDIFRLNPYLIKIKDGFNSRDLTSLENQKHIDELARSIAANGVVMPLTVYWDDGSPVLTDGECRLMATFRAIEVYGAAIRTIPAKTEVRGTDEAGRLVTQIVSNAGKPFNVFEMGTVYRRLLGLGYTMSMIAEKAAVSASHVSYVLDLCEAPDQAKKLVLDGKISSSLLGETIKASASKAQIVKTLTAAVQKAEAAGKNRATRKYVDGHLKPTLKQAIFGLIQTASVEEKDDRVTISMSVADYTTMRGLVATKAVKS